MIFTIDKFLPTKKVVNSLFQKALANKYTSIANEYPAEYRNSERSILFDSSISSHMWKTLEPHLTYEDIAGVVPFGFDNGGRWIPIGINECLRFSKYRKGGYFKSHTDGHVALGVDHRSIFTIMVYLNDNFTGGKTTFFDDDGKEILSVTPKTGMALIFNHDVMHLGGEIVKGTKFIVRTDVMFFRYKSSKIHHLDSNEHLEKEYVEALCEDSMKHTLEGNPEEATQKFIDAQKLMCARKSIPDRNPLLPQLGLSKDLWIQLSTYMDLKTLSRLQRLNKGFYEIFKDNELWHTIFKQLWPQLATLEYSKYMDWKNEAYERHHLNIYFKILVLDIGFKNCKVGSLSPLFPFSTFIRKSNGVSIMASEYNKIYQMFVSGGTLVLGKGDPIFRSKNFPVLPLWELVFGIGKRALNNPATPHFLIPLSDPYDVIYKDLNNTLRTPQTRLCFVDTAILSLMASNMTQGVVIDLGHRSTFITPVLKGKVVEEYRAVFPISGANAKEPEDYFMPQQNLIDMIDSVIKYVFVDNINDGYKNIKITGGKVPFIVRKFKEELTRITNEQVVVPQDPVIDVTLGGMMYSHFLGPDDFICVNDKMPFLKQVRYS
uniref:Fe2OG dioxygenase domain-containing protein n=1 Tax=Arcella intermedia TaxID=1963864 RepID=A0A6B2KZU4_9EUKA